MHLLESVFSLVDLFDYIDLEEIEGSLIIREGDINWAPEVDLCVRAAKLLQQFCPKKGVRITVRKNIPDGAGMGGGSSDAATCLIGLNRLWGLGLDKETLMKFGQSLGADVPFFLFGQTAFAEGTGEILSPIKAPGFKALVIYPDAHVETKTVFQHPDLTRNTLSIKITHSSGETLSTLPFDFGHNDLEATVTSMYPPVKDAVNVLNQIGKARMTGSGSAVFYAVKSSSEVSLLADLPPGWKQWVLNGLNSHPLSSWM